MRTTVVTLLALLVTVAPMSPSALAQGTAGTSTFDGDHVQATLDETLPGLRDLTIAASGETVIARLMLPGEDVRASQDDQGFRIRTDAAEVRVQDAASIPGTLSVDEGQVLLAEIPGDVQVTLDTSEDGDHAILTPPTGDALELSADRIQQDGQRLALTGDGELVTTDRRDPANHTDRGRGNGTTDQAGDDGQDGEANTSQSKQNSSGDAADQRDDASEDRSDQDRAPERGQIRAREGSYNVGSVSFDLDGDRVENLTIRGQPLAPWLDIPGLAGATVEKRGPELRLESEDAKLRIRADGGVLLRAESDGRITGRLSDSVDVETREDVFLKLGQLLLVAQGEDLSIDEGHLSAGAELRLAGSSGRSASEDPVWRAQTDRGQPGPTLTLPHDIEGRFIAFTLNRTGIENISVHGTPVGDIGFDPITLEEARRSGAQLHAEGAGFELAAIDAPATRLTVEARNLTSDVPASTTLPSGAQLTVEIEGDEFTLHVTRPSGFLANRTPVDHRPAETPVEAIEGPDPGLRAQAGDGELGVTSRRANAVATSFQGSLNGTEGNITLELGLVRAMLIDDTNGNARVDVGEPAIAEQPLNNGTSTVEGDALVNRFGLWSGTLAVTVEPGNATAKVTYEVTNLSAPPGTLFVLETEVHAPQDARLQPTPSGVVVEKGDLKARYAAAGPVTVDGTDAWADRSIFVDSNGTVSMLLAYPAGDNITHDPTVSIQSVPGAAVVAQIAASPYAIAAGALAAAMLVGATVWAKRRNRPGP